jgi:small subunit ribosomal protein S17
MNESRQKERIGTVLSSKMAKTIVVRVDSRVKHAKYGKVMRQRKKFKVHDEKSIAHVGDTVRIQETRPLSKDKHFRLIEIIKKAQVLSVKPEDIAAIEGTK